MTPLGRRLASVSPTGVIAGCVEVSITRVFMICRRFGEMKKTWLESRWWEWGGWRGGGQERSYIRAKVSLTLWNRAKVTHGHHESVYCAQRAEPHAAPTRSMAPPPAPLAEGTAVKEVDSMTGNTSPPAHMHISNIKHGTNLLLPPLNVLNPHIKISSPPQSTDR